MSLPTKQEKRFQRTISKLQKQVKDLKASRDYWQKKAAGVVITDKQILRLSYAYLGDNGPQDRAVISFSRALLAVAKP